MKNLPQKAKSFPREPSLDSSELRLKVVFEAFNSGLRVKDLDSQAAPWLRRGLGYLEAGKSLTTRDIEEFDKEGGTDHPDPWFG